MTLKYEAKIEQTKTIEVELPAYYKMGCLFLKIIDQNTSFQVREYGHACSIGLENCTSLTNSWAIEQGEKISEGEFITAFIRVGEKVKRELEKAIESDKWMEQEKQLQTVNA